MNGGGGLFELGDSPGMIAGIARAQTSESRTSAAGVEPFRAAVIDPNYFGDDELGRSMKKKYPDKSSIDDNCTTQKSCAEGGEAFGTNLLQMLGMAEEVVQQGEKNVNSTTRAP